MPSIRKWVAHIEGFGLSTEGDTEQEAIENAKGYLRVPAVFSIRVEPVRPSAATPAPGRLQELGLSPRTENILARANITTVAQVLALSDDDLFKIKDFGPRSLDELVAKIPAFPVRPGQAQALAGRLEAGGYPALAGRVRDIGVSLRARQILATIRKYGSYADALPSIRRHAVMVREIDELKAMGLLSDDGQITARGIGAIGNAQSF